MKASECLMEKAIAHYCGDLASISGNWKDCPVSTEEKQQFQSFQQEPQNDICLHSSDKAKEQRRRSGDIVI